MVSFPYKTLSLLSQINDFVFLIMSTFEIKFDLSEIYNILAVNFDDSNIP